MNELYLLNGSTIEYVGPMYGVDAIDNWHDLPKTTIAFFTPYPSPQHARLMAALTSKAEIAFCWGQEDGTAAPTASGTATVFTCPSTRTFFKFKGKVQDIGSRAADTGQQSLIQIQITGDCGTGPGMSIKA